MWTTVSLLCTFLLITSLLFGIICHSLPFVFCFVFFLALLLLRLAPFSNRLHCCRAHRSSLSENYAHQVWPFLIQIAPPLQGTHTRTLTQRLTYLHVPPLNLFTAAVASPTQHSAKLFSVVCHNVSANQCYSDGAGDGQQLGRWDFPERLQYFLSTMSPSVNAFISSFQPNAANVVFTPGIREVKPGKECLRMR